MNFNPPEKPLVASPTPTMHNMALSFFTFLCVMVIGLLLFGSMRNVVLRFVHDDAFYYFGIARNWHRLGISTFDGITRTNGYHPLWQWLLIIPAGWFTQAAPFARAAAAIGVVFIFLAAIMLRHTLVRNRNPYADFVYWWIGGTLVLATIYGMESPLSMVIYAGLIFSLPRESQQLSARRAGLCGLLAALLFLSRIDSIIWIFALDLIAALLFLRFGRNHSRLLRLFSIFVLIQLAIVGAYVTYLIAVWGHPFPVSAMVKGGRASSFSLNIPKSLLFVLSIPVTLIGLALLADFLWKTLRSSDAASAINLAVPAWIGLANLGYMASVLFKGGRETYNWYFVNVVLSGAILLPMFLERYGPPARRSIKGMAIFVCLLLLIVSARGKLFRSSQFVPSYDLAVELSTLEPYTLVFGATDCGILGYFSRQHCINLDGLTNSFQFQDALKDGTVAEWLEQSGLNAHLVATDKPPLVGDRVSIGPGMAGVGRAVEYDLAPWPDPSVNRHLQHAKLYRVLDVRPVK